MKTYHTDTLKLRNRVPLRSGGAGLIEVAVGVAIVVIIFMGLITAYNSFVTVSRENTKNLKAVFLLGEGLQAVKIMRDAGWENIADMPTGSAQYLAFSGGAWATSTTPEYIDGFLRSFVVSEVSRDGNDDIAESGTEDDGTRKIVVSVSWTQRGATTTKSMEEYVTRLLE